MGESVVLVVSWFFRPSVRAWYESFPLDSRSTTFLTLYCWYAFTKVWQKGWRLCHWCFKPELIYFWRRTKKINVVNQSFGDIWPPLNGDKKTFLKIASLYFHRIRSYRFWKGIMKILKEYIFWVNFPFKCNVGYVFGTWLVPNVNWGEISVKLKLCPFIIVQPP